MKNEECVMYSGEEEEKEKIKKATPLLCEPSEV